MAESAFNERELAANTAKPLSATEIRAIREQYGLSQRGFAALLGLGEITIHRYESGQAPDEAPNQLIRFAGEPLNMRDLLQRNGHRLTGTARARAQREVARLLAENGVEIAATMLDVAPSSTRSLKLQVNDALLRHGGREFSPQKLMDMMLFFAAQTHQTQGVFKTKLNKLLWYADFHHFRQHGRSISGSVYIHELYGPVAQGYPLYVARLQQENRLEVHEYQEAGWEYVAEVLRANHCPDTFSLDETAVLFAVDKRFAFIGSSQISDISHQEQGYAETERYQEISYSYAHSLSLNF